GFDAGEVWRRRVVEREERVDRDDGAEAVSDENDAAVLDARLLADVLDQRREAAAEDLAAIAVAQVQDHAELIDGSLSQGLHDPGRQPDGARRKHDRLRNPLRDSLDQPRIRGYDG